MHALTVSEYPRGRDCNLPYSYLGKQDRDHLEISISCCYPSPLASQVGPKPHPNTRLAYAISQSEIARDMARYGDLQSSIARQHLSMLCLRLCQL